MLPAVPRRSGPFGVVLNANAGRVTPRLAANVARVVGDDHVFVTESPEHAQDVLRLCVERDYSTVFAGGGDGTVIDVANTFHRLAASAPRVPAVGVLRLGTGNALARYVGAGRPLKDLSDYAKGGVHRAVPIQMVQSDGTLSPFGGLGHDAAVLNAYVEMKARYAGTPWERLFYGLKGYLLAGFGPVMWQYLRRDNPYVTVTNTGAAAHRIGPDGNEHGEPIPTGGIVYQGPCSMMGVSTSPIIGYGVRFFPYADRRPGRFQLRVFDLTAFESGLHFAACARGTLQHERLHDYYVQRVRVRFSHAMPYQLGGDAKGYRNDLSFAISETPVTFVGRA